MEARRIDRKQVPQMLAHDDPHTLAMMLQH